MIARGHARDLPLSADSVDLIFTDPPYARQELRCYEWLALEAARALKPGGFVAAMCGGSWLNRILRSFDDAGLTFYFPMTLVSNKAAPYLHGRSVLAKAKHLMVWSRGPGRPRVNGVMNMFQGLRDKRFHHWGQDVESARYYIDHFSRPGDLVVDPFVGGGTTAVACALIGRRCLALDIEPRALVTTLRRLAGDVPVQPLLLGLEP